MADSISPTLQRKLKSIGSLPKDEAALLAIRHMGAKDHEEALFMVALERGEISGDVLVEEGLNDLFDNPFSDLAFDPNEPRDEKGRWTRLAGLPTATIPEGDKPSFVVMSPDGSRRSAWRGGGQEKVDGVAEAYREAYGGKAIKGVWFPKSKTFSGGEANVSKEEATAATRAALPEAEKLSWTAPKRSTETVDLQAPAKTEAPPKPVPKTEAKPEAEKGTKEPPREAVARYSINSVVDVPNAPRIGAVRDGLAAIDELHSVEYMPTIPIEVRGANHDGTDGEYWYRGAKAEHIALRLTGQNVRLNALHELGHFMDHQGLGRKGSFASFRSNAKSNTPAWNRFFDQVHQTEHYRRWQKVATSSSVSKRKKNYAEYMMQPDELFARAYSQWVLSKTSQPKVRDEYQKKSGQKAWTEKQWSPEDFAGVSEAVEGIFEEAGWLK